jgi:hypothetical protein
MLVYAQPSAHGKKRLKLAMFEKAAELRMCQENYNSIGQLKTAEVEDTSGLYGHRHMINEVRKYGK